MDRGHSNLKSKIAQFEASNGETDGTPARTKPTQKSPSNPNWQFVDQSCDRKFEHPRNNEQRPKPAIKPLELQRAPQKSADIVSPDKGEKDWISHREEILLSPTVKNQRHMENLSKIISAQGTSNRTESSKPKSSPYSPVIPQVKQTCPNSGNRFHSPVNESSSSGFPPSNPKNISRPDPPSVYKAQCSVPKPPNTDVVGIVSAGNRTHKKVAAFSLGNQPQFNEAPSNKTESSDPGLHSPTPKIPGLQTHPRSSQKSTQQTSPKMKAADDINPVSKGRYQQTPRTVATDVTRNARRRATDHVTDVRGRRYSKLPLADDIPAKPSKKPPQLPVAVDLEMFRSLDRRNNVDKTRVVSLIPEWSVEEEEGENDQEDYEVCVDNNCPTKDGYVNGQQLKSTDSFARLKTNIGDDSLSDDEIYESI